MHLLFLSRFCRFWRLFNHLNVFAPMVIGTRFRSIFSQVTPAPATLRDSEDVAANDIIDDTHLSLSRPCITRPSRHDRYRTLNGRSRDFRFVFQHLPEPINTACLVGVHAVTLDPLLSLYGIIYVTWYTRHLPKATGVRFR